MKLIEVKTARDLKLPGIGVEFVTEGTRVVEVILRPEGEEDSWVIKAHTYSDCLKVSRRVTHELVERFRLSGTVLGVRVQEDFETKREAEDTAGRLTAQAGPGSVELKVTPVMVRVDEAGEPVAAANDNEIPF